MGRSPRTAKWIFWVKKKILCASQILNYWAKWKEIQHVIVIFFLNSFLKFIIPVCGGHSVFCRVCAISPPTPLPPTFSIYFPKTDHNVKISALSRSSKVVVLHSLLSRKFCMHYFIHPSAFGIMTFNNLWNQTVKILKTLNLVQFLQFMWLTTRETT